MLYLYPLRYRCGLGGLPSFFTANPSASWCSSCGQCRTLSHACNFCLSYVEPVLCSFPFLNLLYGVVSLYLCTWCHNLEDHNMNLYPMETLNHIYGSIYSPVVGFHSSSIARICCYTIQLSLFSTKATYMFVHVSHFCFWMKSVYTRVHLQKKPQNMHHWRCIRVYSHS
jgi:hypothetical protein